MCIQGFLDLEFLGVYSHAYVQSYLILSQRVKFLKPRKNKNIVIDENLLNL